MDRRLVLLIAAIVLVAAFLLLHGSANRTSSQVQPSSGVVTSTTAPTPAGDFCPPSWDGLSFNWTCNKGNLSWLQCNFNQTTFHQVNCSASSPGFTCAINGGVGSCVKPGQALVESSGVQNRSGPTQNGTAFANGTAYAIIQVVGNISAVVQNYTPGYCGDGICDNETEGCYSCPSDCACPNGSYCDNLTDSCIPKVVCGDGVCSPGEQSSCCLDCGCSKFLYPW